jgi:hypothetical protein
MLSCSARFVTGMKIKQHINLKCLWGGGGGVGRSRNKEGIDALEDTDLTENE